jgi:proteasome lid subunit RPN8/RPN11
MSGDRQGGAPARRPAAIPIPRPLLEAVYREARAAFPAECCGWLTGPRDQPDRVDAHRPCHNAQATGTHPVAAERDAESAYVIAGDDLLALSRSFDGAQPARIIYHSHPNGRAYLSAVDREVATSPWGDGPTYPVQQLVVGIDAQRVVEAALFAWCEDSGGFVEVARHPGAAV